MAHDLQHYLSKPSIHQNDLRYMPEEVKAELVRQTSTMLSSATLNERLYWLRHDLSAYPACMHCLGPVHGFINGIKGYHSYCSRKCQVNSKEYQAASRNTSLLRYGVEHPAKAAEFQQKRCMTNMQRYGDTHPWRWGGKAFQDAMLSRHGVKNALQDEIIRTRVSQSLKASYVETKLEQRLEEILELENVELMSRYTGHDQPLMWLHKTCNETFYSNIADGKIPSCPRCNGKSKPEYLLYKHLVELLGHDAVRRNDRTLIKPLELDIYLPDYKLAIELNGMFWHSELFLTPAKAKTYHLYKSELCKAQGVQLLQIFDIEWAEKRAIIESKFNHLFNRSERRFARTLHVVDVDARTANEFLKRNHLQGADRASIRLGLADDDGNLYSLMTFTKPRFSKRHQWELSRFANELGYGITGAASRLLTSFERLHQPSSLVTYADARFSQGKMYTNLGLTMTHMSDPNYWYVKGGVVLSRYQAQKHRLPELLGDRFDPKLSERANMNANDWYAVYDCGNYVFERFYCSSMRPVLSGGEQGSFVGS